MIFSEYIFNGKLLDNVVGDDVDLVKENSRLDIIQEEEGDIPGLYRLSCNGNYFQITTIKNRIVGIEFDFEYDTEKKYLLRDKELDFYIGYTTTYEDCIEFLTTCNVNFKATDFDENNSQILIIKSNLILRFYKQSKNKTLFKASIFNLELYNSLINTN